MSYTRVSSKDDEIVDTEKCDEYEDETLYSPPQTQRRRGYWSLLALTCTLGGLQTVWSVILSNGVPRLISLGLSKTLTAIVWIAGPLCGSLVQPCLGLLSDQSRSSWGRRRPFMISGGIGVVLSILALGWIEPIVQRLTELAHGNGPDPSVTIALAVLCIWTLNFAVQAIQMSIRALVVDSCPEDQQSQASSWCATMTGLGNILGYAVGFSKIPEIAPFFTQFQGLCVVASSVVAVTIAVTCTCISEQDHQAYSSEYRGLLSTFWSLRYTYQVMPNRIRRVCHIQVWAWMGWYPFLFYSTTFIGELYGRKSRPDLLRTLLNSKLSIEEEGTRLGTYASFIFAVTSFLVNASLPWLIRIYQTRTANIPTKTEYLTHRLWTLAHVLFAILMVSAIFITTPSAGTTIIGAAGLSWAMTLWAPYSIIGQEIRCSTKAAAPTAVSGQAGTILSLHNVAISMPQIVSALVCSAVFGIARALDVPDGIQWAFSLAGLAGLRAAWLSSEGQGD